MDYKDEQFWLMQGDCLERMKEIPDGSVDSVVCDPPYIGMVNERWDNIKDTDAKEFYKNIFNMLYDKLRFGGRVVIFGSNDTIKYYYSGALFKHRELLVVSKDVKTVSAGRSTRNYKQHVNCSEYVFVGVKDAKEYTKQLLKSCQSRSNLSSKQINTLLGVKTNGGGMWSIYTGDNICNQVPTNEQWEKFRQVFSELPEYHTFKEVFNNDISKGNILCGFDFRFKGRVHPTQKPLKLMEYLIDTYTDVGETVLDFTMGSGTTGVACKNLNRKFIGIEMDTNYFDIAKNRILNTTSQ